MVRRVFPQEIWQRLFAASSELLDWQALGAVGRSNVGRLTALMPFIGYLVVFNPSFVDFFKTALPDVGQSQSNPIANLHSLRLYFLYFGLLSLGLGILLFNMCAPNALRRFASEAEYIAEMEKVTSPSLVVDRFTSTISDFLRLNRGEAASPFFSGQHASFPSKPSGFLHDLVAAVLKEFDPNNIPFHGKEERMGTIALSSPHAIRLGDGYVTTDQAMSRLFEYGNTAEAAFIHSFNEKANLFSKQVYFVDYIAANYSKFYFRLATAVLYAIGFILLAVPTITTSSLVLLSAFSS